MMLSNHSSHTIEVVYRTDQTHYVLVQPRSDAEIEPDPGTVVIRDPEGED